MLQNTVPEVGSLMFMNEPLVLSFWFENVELGREESWAGSAGHFAGPSTGDRCRPRQLQSSARQMTTGFGPRRSRTLGKFSVKLWASPEGQHAGSSRGCISSGVLMRSLPAVNLRLRAVRARGEPAAWRGSLSLSVP